MGIGDFLLGRWRDWRAVGRMGLVRKGGDVGGYSTLRIY